MSQEVRGHQLSWVPFGDSNPSFCLVAQSCPTLWDPMDWSPPGFSVHGTLQARILEWGAISFSRGSSRLRDQTRVSFIGRQILYPRATWEVPNPCSHLQIGKALKLAWEPTECQRGQRHPQDILVFISVSGPAPLQTPPSGGFVFPTQFPFLQASRLTLHSFTQYSSLEHRLRASSQLGQERQGGIQWACCSPKFTPSQTPESSHLRDPEALQKPRGGPHPASPTALAEEPGHTGTRLFPASDTQPQCSRGHARHFSKA